MLSSISVWVIKSISQRSKYINDSCKAVALTAEDELQVFLDDPLVGSLKYCNYDIAFNVNADLETLKHFFR